jgi:hypothetical protein
MWVLIKKYTQVGDMLKGQGVAAKLLLEMVAHA